MLKEIIEALLGIKETLEASLQILTLDDPIWISLNNLLEDTYKVLELIESYDVETLMNDPSVKKYTVH